VYGHQQGDDDMQANDKVLYLGKQKATVLHVQKNGIVIGYWLVNHKGENWMERRVARRDLVLA
jgi:hypothetical protein